MSRAGRAAIAAVLLALVPGLPAPDTAATPGEAAAAPAKRKAPKRCRSRCMRLVRPRPARRDPERLVDLTPLRPPPEPGAPALDPGPPPAPTAVPVAARNLSVAAREFSLTLSRPVVGAGRVRVELRNVGEDPHDLLIGPDDGSHEPLDPPFPETGPGLRFEQPVDLAAGDYLLWCSLEGHEAFGMTARLRVE